MTYFSWVQSLRPYLDRYLLWYRSSLYSFNVRYTSFKNTRKNQILKKRYTISFFLGQDIFYQKLLIIKKKKVTLGLKKYLMNFLIRT